MTFGNTIFLGVSVLFLASGIWFGFREIQVFGYIMTGIAIALAIRNYKLKKK